MAATPKYELFYFNMKGAAEGVRYIFAQAGVEYVDTRFKDQDDWVQNYKTSRSPFGVAPWIEVDGKQIGGAREIARYLGEEFGLAGKNSLENAQIASIGDHFNDMLANAFPCFDAKTDEDKARLMKQFLEKLPKWMAVFERKVSSTGWLYGDSMTWVDCHIARFISVLVSYGFDILADYPKMAELIKRVESQPNIAKWIEKRPKSDH